MRAYTLKDPAERRDNDLVRYWFVFGTWRMSITNRGRITVSPLSEFHTIPLGSDKSPFRQIFP